MEKISEGFKKDYGILKGELDLVVGGPPCQGYSALGFRRTFKIDKKDIPSNYLFRDMINVIKHLTPKAFVFENVSSLMVGRWTKDGEQGEIWKTVHEEFIKFGKKYGYEIEFEVIKAKDYGVPQNRPRLIMIGIKDQYAPEKVDGLPAKGFLPRPTNDFPDPIDLLGDLVDPKYFGKKSTDVYAKDPLNRLQKSLRTRDNKTLMKGDTLLEQEYSKHSEKIIEKFQFMIDNDGKIPEHMMTKKFSQRVIPERWVNGPNITATSLPDDYVHFSQPRTLTVREWARLQMFPDWYTFSGKRTTGGRQRAGDPSAGNWKRDTPKYTQIGNAVPVKLAEEIGKHLMSLISQ